MLNLFQHLKNYYKGTLKRVQGDIWFNATTKRQPRLSKKRKEICYEELTLINRHFIIFYLRTENVYLGSVI